MQKVASLECFFPENISLGQHVTVFIAKEWKGNPTETEEMDPKWFKLNEIPYENMWPDELIWLPQVLAGKTVKAQFMFGTNDLIIDQNIEITN